MKIALLADAYLLDESTGVNGTQVQLYYLAKAFARRGHDVIYIGFSDRKRFEPEIADGITLHYLLRRSGPFRWLAEAREARRQLDILMPDAVYQRGRSHLTYVAARWAKRTGRPFVWGSNGEDSGEFFKHVGRLTGSKRSLFKKVLLLPDMWARDLAVHRGVSGASHIVSQTEFQKARLHQNFGKDAIVLPSYVQAVDDDGAAPKEKMALWLANLSPGKQPEIFIDLAASVRESAGWRFVLVGGTKNNEFRRLLLDRARDVPALEMVGPVPFDQTDTLFSRAALFVNTSRPDSEGLPNAFLQAWLHGTPVFSLHHDPNGWITDHALGHCANGEVKEFAKTVRYYLDHPSKLDNMRPRCRAFARAEFSNEAVTDRYLNLFEARERLLP